MNKFNSVKELFPTQQSLIFFVLYIVLFVNQGILVTASQGSNSEYNYNIVDVVLMTEVFKLIASVLLYLKDHSAALLVQDTLKHRNVLVLYFVPAFLYCLYNNFAFMNLSTFDPTTYYLLLQFRVVVTGVLFQVIFKKQLSKKQWISLVLLTCGCMLKQINFTKENNDFSATIHKHISLEFNISALFIVIQVFCSCLAGVYNEYLLKEKGVNVNIYVQNVFMYLDSIVCNAAVLVLQGNLFQAFTPDSLTKIFHFEVLMIMINNAAIGIITSLFLKTLNSILKTFASALELLLTAVLSYLFFNIPIYLNTVLAICTVLYAIYLYSQNPVVNLPQITRTHEEEKEQLMAEDV